MSLHRFGFESDFFTQGHERKPHCFHRFFFQNFFGKTVWKDNLGTMRPSRPAHETMLAMV